MARSVRNEFNITTGTVIGEGFTAKATHLGGSDDESMRVDGKVTGMIEVGVLVLSETGNIEGDVLANSARLSGRVNGNVECRNALHLTATAVVTGDISAGIIIMDAGAAIMGMCSTIFAD